MSGRHNTALYFASVVSLGGFLFGFDASVISGVVGFIVPEFGLNDWQLGLVAFVLLGWLLPETKGKSLKELELILAKK